MLNVDKKTARISGSTVLPQNTEKGNKLKIKSEINPVKKPKNSFVIKKIIIDVNKVMVIEKTLTTTIFSPKILKLMPNIYSYKGNELKV